MRRALGLCLVGLLCPLMLSCGSGSSLERLLIDAEGQGDGVTTHFEPPGPWTVSYSWDCRTQRSQGVQGADHFTLTVYNADDKTYVYADPITAKSGLRGSGTLQYSRAGSFYMSVQSVCTWRVTANKSS